MVVPGVEEAIQHRTPKLIGDLDFNAGKRRAIFLTSAGVVAAAILIYAIFFYNVWERGNKSQLLAMAYQADQTLNMGKRAEAVDQYQKFVDAVGKHELSDSTLISKYQSAQSAISSYHEDQNEAARKADEEKEAARRPPPLLVWPPPGQTDTPAATDQSVAAQPPSSSTGGSYSPGNNRDVYVNGYVRKDGTYVQPYTRAAPGSGTGRGHK